MSLERADIDRFADEGCPNVGAHERPWEEHWGRPYNVQFKTDLFRFIFQDLEMEDKLGDVIVDVGSGAFPASAFAPNRKGRRSITIDLEAPNLRYANIQHIGANAELVAHPHSIHFKRALGRARSFLNIPKGGGRRDYVDTMLFSELLNYVDFRRVLKGFSQFLKPDGRMIIFNMPGRGFSELFSSRGVKSNDDLLSALATFNLEIEYKEFPLGKDRLPPEHNLIMLVAVKGS